MKKQLQMILMVAALLGATLPAAANVRPNGAGLAKALRAKKAADVNQILSTLKISGVDGQGLIDAVGKTISADKASRIIDLIAKNNSSDAKKVAASAAIFDAAIKLNQSSSLSTANSGMLSGSTGSDADRIKASFDKVVTLAISSMDGSAGNDGPDLGGLTQAAKAFAANANNIVTLRESLRAIINTSLKSQGLKELTPETDPLDQITNC
jgi:cobalamin biosynthesis protein CobT